MGTRSLTHVYDEAGKVLVTMYRQMDGYPSVHGKELAKFLLGKQEVNGISSYTAPIFNGAGCLAAQLVAHFKDGPGSIYIQRPGAKDCGEEYVYKVKPAGVGHPALLECYDVDWKAGKLGKKLFAGTPDECLAAITVKEAAE